MERPTDDELHKRCRKDEPLIDLIHADKEPVLQHEEHGSETKGSGDDAAAQHCARGTRATSGEFFAQRRARGFNVILVTHDLREAVFLADTVYVMSSRPGRIVKRCEVGIARPRDLEVTYTPEFQEIVHELRHLISRSGEGAH